MKLTTPISIPKSEFNVSHQSTSFLIGSCFSQNIGEKLINNKFNVNINPSGIIYNPISIVSALERIINQKQYTEQELTNFNSKWISFNHHGSFSSLNKTTCLNQINNSQDQAHQQLKKCETIFITFGSAWVYEYPEFGIVANCHKLPNSQFKKRLLSVKEILAAFNRILDELKHLNVVFTVSPIRHIKDGLHENNLNKSTLHLAINNLIEQNENCHYFPAYELIIDELRDYRFYKDDLVHPTEFAINYVWGKFSECYFNDETQALNSEIQKIKVAVNHKPFYFKSEEHQQFIATQIQNMEDFSNKYPFIDFTFEKKKIADNPIL